MSKEKYFDFLFGDSVCYYGPLKKNSKKKIYGKGFVIDDSIKETFREGRYFHSFFNRSLCKTHFSYPTGGFGTKRFYKEDLKSVRLLLIEKDLSNSILHADYETIYSNKNNWINYCQIFM